MELTAKNPGCCIALWAFWIPKLPKLPAVFLTAFESSLLVCLLSLSLGGCRQSFHIYLPGFSNWKHVQIRPNRFQRHRANNGGKKWSNQSAGLLVVRQANSIEQIGANRRLSTLTLLELGIQLLSRNLLPFFTSEGTTNIPNQVMYSVHRW
eukprot:s56_g4.t1